MNLSSKEKNKRINDIYKLKHKQMSMVAQGLV